MAATHDFSKRLPLHSDEFKASKSKHLLNTVLFLQLNWIFSQSVN
jgi:hypothetical protein